MYSKFKIDHNLYLNIEQDNFLNIICKNHKNIKYINRILVREEKKDYNLYLVKTNLFISSLKKQEENINYYIVKSKYLNEENVSKEIITKYLIDIHNMINEDLDKHLKMSFKNAIEIQKKTIDSDILFFIKIVYKQFDYINMSFFEFDKIYNFFICFVQNYPSKKINIILNDLISKKDFSDADTPMSFKKWFMKNYCTLHVVSTIQQSSFMKKKL